MPEIQIGISNGGRLPLYIKQINIYAILQDEAYGHSLNVDEYFEKGVRITPQEEKMIKIDSLSRREVLAAGESIRLIKDLTKDERIILYANTNTGVSIGGRKLSGSARCGFDVSTFRDNIWPEESVAILARRIKCDQVGPMLLHLYESQAGDL